MANQERLEIEKEENMKRMKENMTKVTKKVQVFSDPWTKQFWDNLEAITSNIQHIRN